MDLGLAFLPGTTGERIGKSPFGGFYSYQLNAENSELTKVELIGYPHPDFHPHGIYIQPVDSRVLVATVCHHRDGDSVETFEIQTDSTTGSRRAVYLRSVRHPLFRVLNDVVLLDENSFYVTNWHYYPVGSLMGLLEDVGQFAWAFVIYCWKEASATEFFCKKVGVPVVGANGINISPDKKTVYVAGVTGPYIMVFSIIPGDLKLLDTIPLGKSGPDNIDVDPETGDLLVMCHPRMFVLLGYSKDPMTISSPCELLRIKTKANYSKGDYQIEDVFVHDGSVLPACTIGVRHKNQLAIGSVFRDGFLLCSTEQ